MIKDVGIANIPLAIENSYKQFRQEYNSLVQKIRDIAEVLDREPPPALNGTVTLMFIEKFKRTTVKISTVARVRG